MLTRKKDKIDRKVVFVFFGGLAFYNIQDKAENEKRSYCW